MENKKKKILLHSCCGPCSTAVLEKLVNEYEIEVFFYNPNITDKNEYQKRLHAQKMFIDLYNETLPDGYKISFLEGSYETEEFFNAAKGLDDEKEGGLRCRECFKLRLLKTAATAREREKDLICTTLTVSPHKNSVLINQIGIEAAGSHQTAFLESDFKKKDGYRRSVEMSKEYGLYRQKYCGCVYSEWWK